jgi:hypothetical protein
MKPDGLVDALLRLLRFDTMSDDEESLVIDGEAVAFLLDVPGCVEPDPRALRGCHSSSSCYYYY